ncbi:MAG: glycosyltransferase family 4 protein [Desulfobacterales bacterium]
MEKKHITVCIVSPFPPPFGGMAVQAEKLASHLECEGFPVIRVRTNTEFPEIFRFVSKIPVLRTVFNLVLFLKNLHKALGKSDIVYFFTAFYNFFFWVTYPAIILIKLCGKKVILSARGGSAGEFFRQYRWILKPVISKADKVTTPSGFLAESFWQAFGIKTTIVPTIADLHQFHFRERDCFQPLLLSTRNLEEIYDVACIIRAFRIVRDRYPDARLGIAGEGSLRKELEKLVSDLKLEESVVFYGSVNHQKMQNLYQEYDIWVNASKDNLPGTILEAYASGSPSGFHKCRRDSHIVADGKTGLLANIGDRGSLCPEYHQNCGKSRTWQITGQSRRRILSDLFLDQVKDILIPLLYSAVNQQKRASCKK